MVLPTQNKKTKHCNDSSDMNNKNAATNNCDKSAPKQNCDKVMATAGLSNQICIVAGRY